ncbi:MAG: hypothetical protein HY073_01455 [Deltaproteobacteria bacterium]|nr:hypothetical protein [Deltaproteobacteria bacterium]
MRAYLTLLAGLDSVGALSELEWVREEKRGKQFLERSLVVDPTRLERAGLGGRESLLRIKETLLGALLFDVDAGALLGQLQTRYPDLEDETLHKRRYPRGSMADTAWVGDSGRAEYAHSSTESFIGDREILRVILHPDQFSMHFNDEDNVVFYGITNNGKTVLQQPGCRACGAACGVMLLMDHRKEPDLDWLVNCNLENESSMISGLIKNGLPVKISSVFYKSEGRAMSKRERGRRLEDLVSTGGSGILSIVGEIGGHFILVDHFCMATDRAVIRDPFHGWCIETTANAILERNPTRMIQVEQV